MKILHLNYLAGVESHIIINKKLDGETIRRKLPGGDRMSKRLFLCEYCGKNNTFEELKSCMADFCDMKCYNEYHKQKEEIRIRTWVINKYQESGEYHPFTCGKGKCNKILKVKPYGIGEKMVLFCECGYKQILSEERIKDILNLYKEKIITIT